MRGGRPPPRPSTQKSRSRLPSSRTCMCGRGVRGCHLDLTLAQARGGCVSCAAQALPASGTACLLLPLGTSRVLAQRWGSLGQILAVALSTAPPACPGSSWCRRRHRAKGLVVDAHGNYVNGREHHPR
eukprot:scaffold3396_cov385-Prasinococcus_capsulatus_cf.AAC.2